MTVIQREVRLGNLDVPVVYENGQPYVILRPVVNALGMNWVSVFKAVRLQSKFTKHETNLENVTVPMITLEPIEFMKWLLVLAKVPDEAAADHQSMIKDALALLGDYVSSVFGALPPQQLD